jgi:hypothetical protein
VHAPTQTQAQRWMFALHFWFLCLTSFQRYITTE